MYHVRDEIQDFTKLPFNSITGVIIKVTGEEGDTLSGIAFRAGLDPGQFTRAIFQENSGSIYSPDLIFPGQNLIIPCEFVDISRVF